MLSPVTEDVNEPTRDAAGRTDAPLSWFRRGLMRLPDRIAIVFLALAVSVAATVSTGQLRPWLVFTIFAALLIVLWRFVPAEPRSARTPARSWMWGSVISCVLALGWVAWNIPLASQLLWVTRDPGIYTVLGVWLMHHPSPLIEAKGAVQLAQGIPSLSYSLGAFGVAPNGNSALQGGALLPGMLAVGGWFGGVKGLLATNVVYGGGVLIALYGLARRVVGPWLALAPQVAVALSIGFLFLTRAPYSEIIMTWMCAAAVTWLISAYRESRFWLYVVAGLFAGVSSFARIDGAIAVIGLVAALGLGALLIADDVRGRRHALGALGFAAAGGLALVGGILSLKHNEPGYYAALHSQANELWLGTGAVFAFMLVLLAVRLFWRGGLPDSLLTWLATIAAVGLGGGFVFLLSRPLWEVAHNTTGPAYIANIGAIQAQEGLPVDGTRSYDEESMSWFGWYFGWPTVALIGIGLCLMIFIAIRARRLPLLAVTVSAASAAALYMVRVQITPDQPWAFRRVLPIITVGFLTAAMYPLWLMWRRGGWRRLVGAALALVVGFGPLITWNGLVLVPDEDHEYQAATDMCAHLDPKEPVLLAAPGAPANIALTIRTLCGAQVVTGKTITEQTMLAVRDKAPETQVLVFEKGAVPGSTKLGQPTGSTTIVRWRSDLMKLPNEIYGIPQQFWVGTISPSGDFEPAS